MRLFRRDPERAAQARARLAFRRAMQLNRNNQPLEAIVWFERAIEHNPNLFEARINLAAIYYRMSSARAEGHLPGWLDEAAKQLQFVLGLDPDNVTAGLNLAAVLQAQSRTAETVELLARLARAWPKHRDVHYNLAVAYLHDKQLEPALDALATELANDPEHAAAKDLLARLRSG